MTADDAVFYDQLVGELLIDPAKVSADIATELTAWQQWLPRVITSPPPPAVPVDMVGGTDSVAAYIDPGTTEIRAITDEIPTQECS